MTVMERLTNAAATHPQWSVLIRDRSRRTLASTNCQAWGRKGGSHYKDGQFSKK